MSTRRAILFAALALTLTALQAAPAAAHGKKGHDEEEQKYEDNGRGNKYKVKRGKHGQKIEYKAKSGPPPWAPAHGYRRKHRDDGGDVAYLPPFEIDRGRCNRDLLGAAIGGAVGGVIGNKASDKDRRELATIAGSIIGILVGGSIGRAMDQVDQGCIGQVLEHAPDQETIRWNNPQSGADYTVIPVSTGQDATGRYCREYQTTIIIDGRRQQGYGTACRQPDGSWQRVG